VVNRTKDTTSLRLVFDAKAKDRSGGSMNGSIEKGPNRLNDLFAILLPLEGIVMPLQLI
jgi:hypothetical protein